MSLKRFLLVRFGRVISYPIRRQLWKFETACQSPEAVQAELLLSILRNQKDTAFGRDHGFAAVHTVADYRKAVPVKPYEYVAPYIDRVTKGETNALLSANRVHLFALTSGTTASRKLIPVTDDYLAADKRGWNMWGIKMYRDNRGRRVAMRPIVQMVGDPEEYRTPAGIPCGNLSGYTAMVQKRLIRWMYAVPYLTGKIKDAKARYYVALRFSISRNVSQFIAANPSTLVQFARTLDAEKESLLRDLRDGTLRHDLDIPADVRDFLTRKLPRDAKKAAQLAAIAEKTGHLLPTDVWPAEGTVINVW
ncbi:MAG TPA: GH3 auxin-responsive promoter family protein, partial [Gemmata sp.]|nr:GH3 auxin-responsive promoter family protein [Gemmata sp.]